MALQIGISSYFNPDLPPAKVSELLIQADIKVISVWGASADGLGLMPSAYKDVVRSAREDYGFILESMHAPFLLTPGLSSSDESVRTKTVDRLRQAIADAVELDIPILIVHAHQTGGPDTDCPAGRQSYVELVEELHNTNVRLALENTRQSVALLEWVLGEFPARKVGLCYDSGHDQLATGQTFEFLRHWGGRLLTTHIHDNHGQSDDHLPPGEGVIDWQAFARAFPWNTYRGYFMLEANMSVTSFKEPAEFLARCRAGAQMILELAGGSIGD